MVAPSNKEILSWDKKVDLAEVVLPYFGPYGAHKIGVSQPTNIAKRLVCFYNTSCLFTILRNSNTTIADRWEIWPAAEISFEKLQKIVKKCMKNKTSFQMWQIN